MTGEKFESHLIAEHLYFSQIFQQTVFPDALLYSSRLQMKQSKINQDLNFQVADITWFAEE